MGQWCRLAAMSRDERPRRLRAVLCVFAVLAVFGQERLSAAAVATTNVAPVHAVVHVPREHQHFTFWQKINPVWWFGNADDPVPPRKYRPGKRTRKFTWYLRN